jgi:predicted nucleic-acid-binding protein
MTMFGVDTNVLLRIFVTEDDVSQSSKATAFAGDLGPGRSIYVNDIVLVELLWTLRSQYGFGRGKLLDLVHALLERTEVEFADREAVKGALHFAMQGADFSDALIALGNSGAGCAHTVTFDQNAAKFVPGMELL